jgi:hypothetical protein
MEDRVEADGWRMLRLVLFAWAFGLGFPVPAASAQDVSENRNWQFSTPHDLAARAAALDLMMKRAGVYAAPVYNTTIDRQYNCSVGASATGNSGAQSAVGNSPTVTGTSAHATGNASTSESSGEGGGVDVGQHNGGQVGASAVGSSAASVSGSTWQALNSDQRNSGIQSARVEGSTACGFGVLN